MILMITSGDGANIINAVMGKNTEYKKERERARERERESVYE